MASTFRKTTLPNGLRVVSEYLPGTRTAAMGVWVLCGARHESLAQAGISHLLEHLVFKGTRNRTAYEIAVHLEALGGQINAVTDREYTCYYAQFLGQHLEYAVDVLADLMQNALIRPADLALEKQVVIEEIRNLEDNPEDLVLDDLIEIFYPGQPMGGNILGSEKSIKKIKRSDLLEYMKTWYNGANLLVSAAGAVDHDELVAQVSKYFEALPSGQHHAEGDVSIGKPVTVTKHRPVSQAHVALGVSSPDYLDPDKYPLIVANTYLGGGMASLLFQKLREESGLVYTVYSWTDFWKDAGQMGIYLGTSPERRQEAVDQVMGCIQSLLDQKLSRDTLSRIQNQIIFGFQMASEDPQIRMQRLAKMEIYCGRFTEDHEIIHRFQSVSAADVWRVANQVLGSDPWFSASIEPNP